MSTMPALGAVQARAVSFDGPGCCASGQTKPPLESCHSHREVAAGAVGGDVGPGRHAARSLRAEPAVVGVERARVGARQRGASQLPRAGAVARAAHPAQRRVRGLVAHHVLLEERRARQPVGAGVGVSVVGPLADHRRRRVDDVVLGDAQAGARERHVELQHRLAAECSAGGAAGGARPAGGRAGDRRAVPVEADLGRGLPCVDVLADRGGELVLEAGERVRPAAEGQDLLGGGGADRPAALVGAGVGVRVTDGDRARRRRRGQRQGDGERERELRSAGRASW